MKMEPGSEKPGPNLSTVEKQLLVGNFGLYIA